MSKASSTATGETVTLKDQAGKCLTLRILRPIRFGHLFYFVATSVELGGLYVLGRDETGVRLVTDPAILQRVEQQLMVLADATHGEIIEWTIPGQPPSFWGVVYALFVEQREILLAASLVDPSVVGAFARTREGVSLIDDANELAAVQRRFDDLLAHVERDLPVLQTLTAGMWGEGIVVEDRQGRPQGFRARGRVVFERRHVIFLAKESDANAAAPLEVLADGRLEPVEDPAFMARLTAYLKSIAGRVERAVAGAAPTGDGSRSPG